jgi:ATP-dependent Clp protease protease subunit
MIHQLLGGAHGQATDMEIQVKHMLSLKKTLTNILSKHTGKPYEEVYEACERDNFLSADEAKEFGLVDEVVASRKDVPNLPGKSSADGK